MALTDDQISSVIYHLGWSETEGTAGDVIAVSKIKGQIALLTSSYMQGLVVDIITAMDAVNTYIPKHLCHQQASRVEGILTNPDEMKEIRRNYKAWGYRLGDILRQHPNPDSDRYSGRANVRVIH